MPQHKPLLVLLEDDPDEAHLLQWQLQQHPEPGFQVLVAETLAAFFQLLKNLPEQPALLLVDLNLPDSSGLNTVTACRSCLPDVPLVVHSGWFDVAEQKDLLAAGAQACLTKGQPPAVLINQLLKLLER
ncbi:response regulator [Marinospirillum alkaliphilum]|nr:response regulator [Marinospirillum alkaliphilum]